MKKLVAFLLITVYSFAMAGTTIAMHYCMGERVSTTLSYEEQAVCEFCHMEKHSGDTRNMCCEDDHEFVKVHADQDLAASISSPQLPVLFLSTSMHDIYNLPFRESRDDHNSDFSRPPNIPAHKLHCVYRI